MAAQDRTLQEVSSTVYPDLERKPGKQNWVDAAGGLPSYIERIAKHLHYEKGKSISTAIAMAVNTVKRWATGTNHNGGKLKPETVAKAQAAVAEWEAKKGKAKGKSLAEAAYEEAPAGIELSAEDRASLVGAFSYRLTLLEGFALNLKGRSTRGKAAALDNATALLEGRKVKLGSHGGQADPQQLARAQSALGQEAADLRAVLSCLEAFEGPQVKAARQAVRKQAKGRNGQAVFDESKHPRAGKGAPTGGQFIRKGATGSEVKGVQRRLGVKADGKFGNKTKKAVEDFQRKHGLSVDGVIGSETAGALRGTSAAPGPLLGHQRGALRKMKAGGGTTPPEKRFSPDALAAADAAEKARNKRHKAAKEAREDAKSNSDSSSSTDSSSSEGGEGSTLGPDSSLPEKVVQLLQRRLGIETTGEYDEATEKAIRQFQRENGLLVDGIVGTQTLAALRGDESPPEPGGFSESDWSWLTEHQAGGQRERRQKKKRDERQQERDEKREQRELSSKRVAEAMVKDDFVRRYGAGMAGAPDEATGHLQRRLTELGYEAGPDDGRFGEKTKAAVAAFQGEHGLKEDGEVGHDTKLALRGTDPEEVARRRTAGEEEAEKAQEESGDKSGEKPARKSAEGDQEETAAETKEPSQSHSLAGAVLTKGAGVDSEEPDPSVEQMQSIIGTEVDGRFGPETEKKLKSTQRRFGLKADGVVGPKTGRLLDRMASKHKPDPKKMEEAALDAAILDRMEAQASGDSVAFTRARGREAMLRRRLSEASLRGAAGAALRDFYRLDDGTFAPKGRGRILTPGEEISIPHRSGKGMVRARVEHTEGGKGVARLLDGPDADRLASVRTAAPDARKVRPFPESLERQPGWMSMAAPASAREAEMKAQSVLDNVRHYVANDDEQGATDWTESLGEDREHAANHGWTAAVRRYDEAEKSLSDYLNGDAGEADAQRAPIDFTAQSDEELDRLASDAAGKTNVRDRSIFQAATKEQRTRAERAYRDANKTTLKSAAADFLAQLNGKRPTDAPEPQYAPPEGYQPNTSDTQIKDMVPGDTFYIGKYETPFVYHKAVNPPFIVAKPVGGGKAKPFHQEMAPAFLGPHDDAYPASAGADTAPTPSGGDDDLFDKLKASVEETGGGSEKSPARSPSGNLRNFKAMSDSKLMGLAQEMKDHPDDIEAIKAITTELQKRAGAKDEPVPINPVPKEEKGFAIPPPPEAQSGPKTAEPAVNKSKDEKVAAAWGAYNKKKAEFDALPKDADKATRSKLASQVRAAKFRIKRVGGDPDKPPDSAEAALAKPKAAKKAATPKPKAVKEPKAESEKSMDELVAEGVRKEHQKKAQAVADKAAHKLGSDWDAAAVAAALDKLETSGLIFDRENESPDTLAAVIKAAGLDPANLKTLGTTS